MDVIDVWTGARAIALCDALRMTYEGFAAKLGRGVSTVHYWRSHPGARVRKDIAGELDVMLERGSAHAQELFWRKIRADAPPVTFEHAGADNHGTDNTEDDLIAVPCRAPDGRTTWVSVPRRTFLLGGLAVATGAMTGGPTAVPDDPAEIEFLRRGLDDTIRARSLARTSIDDWEQVVQGHGQATRERPAALMLNDLSDDLAELRRILAECRSPSDLPGLMRIAAQLGGLTCLTLTKTDDWPAFRQWARTTRTAAKEAGDPLIYSWVRGQEAYGYYYVGRHAEAIDIAQHAQQLSGRTPSVGAVLAAALEGRAYAALGPGRAREARAALHRAEDILASLDDASVVPSAFGYNEAQLRFHAGNALTHLHDTEGAWREQERALQLYPTGDFLDRTLTQLDRAYCLAHDGDAAGATSYATHALAGLTEQQRNQMITAQAGQVLAALPPNQQDLPAARTFRELLDSFPDAREVPA